MLFRPDSQLYLLDAEGRVLDLGAHRAHPDLRVAMGPVRESAGAAPSAYVMNVTPNAWTPTP